jgi:serine phosphatase RsbU (regulator of sigma subunit)
MPAPGHQDTDRQDVRHDVKRQTAAVPGPRRPEADPATDGPRAAEHASAPHGTPHSAPQPAPTLNLLVIGEDPVGPFTRPELVDSAGTRVRLRRARNLTEAHRLLTDDVHCVLLDLGHGADAPALEGLREVLRMAPRTAVLTTGAPDGRPEGGREDSAGGGPSGAEWAAEAVRIGAQDHLSREELEGTHLTRAIRYAVERKRADLAQRQLTETRLLAQENRRLERGLLPVPLLDGADLGFASRYRPGRSRALLGGDFYDAVRTPDGTVRAMIGDVCGHGPDEAALGVELRIAWRALTLAGLSGSELLRTLQQVLEFERADEEIFATMCTLDIRPDGRTADLHLAGHPAPLLVHSGADPLLLPHDRGGPALGLLPEAEWERERVELGERWSLLLYTDGIIEGYTGGAGTARLGQDGMAAVLAGHLAAGLSGEELLDATLAEVRGLNGGELTDDVALVLLGR